MCADCVIGISMIAGIKVKKRYTDQERLDIREDPPAPSRVLNDRSSSFLPVSYSSPGSTKMYHDLSNTSGGWYYHGLRGRTMLSGLVVIGLETKTAHFLPNRKEFSMHSRLAEMFQARNRATNDTPSANRLKFQYGFSSRYMTDIRTYDFRHWKDMGGLTIMCIRMDRKLGRLHLLLSSRIITVACEGMLKEAQTRQKSYARKHRRLFRYFSMVTVFLKVLPTLGGQGVLVLRASLVLVLIGPFENSGTRYKYHHLHVVSYPFGQIVKILSYTEEPESILDRQDRVMRNKTIPFVKILWRNHSEREATWETEESIRTSYPHFLP
ncbi:putative nucleotidyltransferase, ribonuclease H [Tanacetum coccineum]|uniref:Nucleotidyltransferase, ribonuclease H n=1 Tax=Tanacetum coccineum TaxID=301880 RepID=A0ABQ5GMQ1_9ASTR